MTPPALVSGNTIDTLAACREMLAVVASAVTAELGWPDLVPGIVRILVEIDRAMEVEIERAAGRAEVTP